jgi:hypothetical protein
MSGVMSAQDPFPLNECFAGFDKITGEFELEKINTNWSA